MGWNMGVEPMMLESQSSALTVSPIPPQHLAYHAFFSFFVKSLLA